MQRQTSATRWPSRMATLSRDPHGPAVVPMAMCGRRTARRLVSTPRAASGRHRPGGPGGDRNRRTSEEDVEVRRRRSDTTTIPRRFRHVFVVVLYAVTFQVRFNAN